VSSCVFVDRDGTLIEDRGYMHRIEDYARLPGAVPGLRLLADAGYPIAIVTNQSGIGRGYFDEAAFQRFHDHVLRDFASQGIRFAATYFCPHAPDAGCDCRKPAPGLLRRAARELGVDLGACWMIGDQPTDVDLALNAGCRAIRLVAEPASRAAAPHPREIPTVHDLEAAARLILTSATQLAQ
jgi:D-glycero-D-manno-heptose 1,7-bisphosphate phosphatase